MTRNTCAASLPPPHTNHQSFTLPISSGIPPENHGHIG
jgi:hypothetical protein